VSYPYISDRYRGVFGLESGDTKTDQERLLHATHPDDREAWIDAFAVAARTLEPIEVDRRVEIATGELRWIRTLAQAHREPTGEVVFDGMSLDVTREREAELTTSESERRIRLVTDALPILIASFDTSHVYRFINEYGAGLYARPAAEIVGRTIEEIVGPVVHARYLPYLVRTLAGERVTLEETITYPDGKTRLISAICVPDIDAEGNITGAFAMSLDMSDRRMAEQHLRQTRKMEAIGQLTGGMAHKFNNILAAITGFAELLEPLVAADETADRYLERIETSAWRGAEIVSKLLAFGRKQPLMPRAIDLNEIVTGAADVLASILPAVVTVETDCADDLWLAWADPNQLQSALLNLALNARDAMPEGGVMTF
jgi:PAS domain S-box-containing protein